MYSSAMYICYRYSTAVRLLNTYTCIYLLIRMAICLGLGQTKGCVAVCYVHTYEELSTVERCTVHSTYCDVPSLNSDRHIH